MTKITTYNRGIIIDGHADTKEECETITLLCNSLAKDENFKQVAYDDGYAAFQKIGKAERLRFVGGGLYVIFDSNITKVTCVMNDTTYSATTSGENITPGMDSADFTVELVPGYELATAVAEKGGIIAINGNSFHYNWGTAGTTDTITITSKAASSKLSVDLTTLPGWANLSAGNHTIKIKAKGTGYKDSELSAGVTVSKVGVNPTVVSTTGLQSSQTLVAITDENLLTNSLVKSFYNNYKTKSLSDLFFNLRVDTVEPTTIDGVSVTYGEYDKLSEDCSIFVVKEGDNYYFDLPGALGETIISSPQLEGQTYEPAKILFCIVGATNGVLHTIPCKNITGQQGTAETLDDIGVAFLAVRTKVTLEEGTYKWKNTPSIENDISVSLNFTSNNVACTGISVYYGGIESSIQYNGVENDVYFLKTGWKNTAFQTITLSASQTVSAEFYKWAITQGNLVKQAGYKLTLQLMAFQQDQDPSNAYIKINSDTVSSTDYDYMIQGSPSSIFDKNGVRVDASSALVITGVYKVAWRGAYSAYLIGEDTPQIVGSQYTLSTYELSGDTTLQIRYEYSGSLSSPANTEEPTI